jgi:serine/threonine-protein kinase
VIGETIGGRYQVLRLLGEGGMGSVYEARHTGTGRRVAVKVVSAELVRQPDALARFEIEARAAGAIESLHIAQVLDVGVDPARGAPFLVMEYLTGEDLERIEGRLQALPSELVIRIGAQACMGLSRAHAAGIVHRDIKPANLFITERDGGELIVKLLDFGIAKLRPAEAPGNEGHKLTRTGALVGSPLYMSPEQAQGEATIDARSDLWSLGVTLYQALAGRAPHQDAETVGKLIVRICTTPAPPLHSVAPWVSPELAAIIDRALRVAPGRRFQSADEMLEALRRLAPDGLTIRSSMLVRAAGAPSSYALAAFDSTRSSESTTMLVGPRHPRARAIAYGAGAAALGALGVLGYAATHTAASATAEAPAPASASAASAPVVAAQVSVSASASASPPASSASPPASSASPAASASAPAPVVSPVKASPRASVAPVHKPPQPREPVLHDPTTQM